MDCDSAERYFKKAETIYKQKGCTKQYLESKNNRLRQLTLQEKGNDAIKLCDTLINETENKLGKRNAYLAEIYFNSGFANYLIRNYVNSKILFKKALAIYKIHNRTIDANYININLYLGRDLSYLYQFDSAFVA